MVLKERYFTFWHPFCLFFRLDVLFQEPFPQQLQMKWMQWAGLLCVNCPRTESFIALYLRYWDVNLKYKDFYRNVQSPKAGLTLEVINLLKSLLLANSLIFKAGKVSYWLTGSSCGSTVAVWLEGGLELWAQLALLRELCHLGWGRTPWLFLGPICAQFVPQAASL